MAIVITNGQYYICYSGDRRIRKTTELENAVKYGNVSEAIEDVKRAPAKTKGYYVYDTMTRCVYRRNKKKSSKRKSHSRSVRKMIYNHAEGRCQLCGRKIKFEDMTLDHVIPLAMGGNDAVGNLQCACEFCNRQKGSYLPDDFVDRIAEIFLYQMEKKYGNGFRWRVIRKVLEKL